MATQNQALKQQFERQFSGTNVMLNYGGSAAALQALREGKIDLAAIGRPLTWTERQEGFQSVPLNRGKIALMVSPENPFTGNITTRQFAQIFRGEITDWSQLGGAPGRIRLIDRPDLSDMRTSFRYYPVFQEAPFQTGTNAVRTSADSTQAAIAQLGRDGISFAPANQVMGQPNVRIVPMHRTLPDNPRYPFSQPFYYVYKGTPSPAAANFLGFVTAPPGQQALLAAKPTEAAIAAGEPTTGNGTATSTTALNASPTAPNAVQSDQTPGNSGANPPGSPNAAQSSQNLSNSGANPTGAPNTAQSGQNNPANATPSGQNSPGSSTPQNSTIAASPAPQTAGSSTTAQNPTAIFPPAIDPATVGTKLPAWLWWLFPLGFGALLGILLLARSRRSRRVSPEMQTSTPPLPSGQAIAPPPPPPIGPSAFAPNSTEPDLAARTELVVNSDRASIRSVNSEEDVADDLDVAPAAALPVEAEVAAPGIEAEEITSNPAAGLAGGAMLGGAAIAALSGMRLRSGQPRQPATEPLATFDQIEALDGQDPAFAEVQAEDTNLIDLDAVPSIAEPSEASPEVDRSTASLTTLDAIEVENNQTLAFLDTQGEVIDLDATPSIVEVAAEDSEPTLETELSKLENSLDRAEEITTDSATLQETPFPFPRETAPDAIVDGGPETPLSEPIAINAANAAMGGAALAGLGFLGATTLGTQPKPTPSDDEIQTDIEAAKFDIGQTDLSSETLAAVDADLPDLPDGYGETRIVLMPRDTQWAYAYWDISNEAKVALRQQGGQTLVLRLCDVTDIDIHQQAPHSIQQFDCDELARDWYLSIPVSDRDYLVEIGYLTASGQWLRLARSLPVRVPPVYPSDWLDEQFVTINWEEDLRGKQFGNLVMPRATATQTADTTIYDRLFPFTQGAEAQRVAGSLFGSMQQAPTGVLSSFVFPSGMGAWALPTPSGMGLSGMTLSGVGLAALPLRSRKFWFVADAELIVYGATEPDATVTIAGEPIPLSPEGTFRIHIPFPDGFIHYPIMAVAKDGEQTRSIHLQFNRETPKRNTNHKEE
jgi:ABC-type phosphate transport system substrate-binding protein